MQRGYVVGAAALTALLTLAFSAVAEEKRGHLGDYRDWSTFRDIYADGTRVCYMITQPKEATADKPNVKRGAIYVMVSHWPDSQIRDQVRISGGYPYKPSSKVRAVIDGNAFDLFTEDQDAWAHDAQEDARLVGAMKSGLKLTVEGESSRGTKTVDEFSLSGFTAAHNAISKACG